VNSQRANFLPEEINLIKSALDGATAQLLPHKRLSTMNVILAEGILKSAATGERDPMR